MELEDGGASPQVDKPGLVSHSAVDDGCQGQQVTAAAQHDDRDDVEEEENSGRGLSEDRRLTGVSVEDGEAV